MREIDTDVEVESVTRRDLVFRVAVLMDEWRPNGQIVRLATVRRNSSLHECGEKRLRASVGNRRFGAIEFDIQVIDECPRHSGQHVLHGVQRVLAFTELGTAFSEYRNVGGRRVSLASPIGANESDTGSSRGRTE